MHTNVASLLNEPDGMRFTDRRGVTPLFPASAAPDPGVVESLDAIIWEADPVTFQFLYVNRAAEKLLGYPLADWLSRPTFWVERLHPEDRDAAVALCRAAVEEGRDHDFECRLIAADGSIRWLHDIVSVGRGKGGRVDRLRGLMVDITDAKMRLEQTFQRGGGMETLARITRAVAHDLQNVLTVVQDNVEFALENPAGAGVGGELTEIREAANVGKLILELLSALGGRHRPLTVVDVNDAVRRRPQPPRPTAPSDGRARRRNVGRPVPRSDGKRRRAANPAQPGGQREGSDGLQRRPRRDRDAERASERTRLPARDPRLRGS